MNCRLLRIADKRESAFMRHHYRGFLIALAVTIPSCPALAADFNAMVAAAYAPYRSADSYLRTGNPGLASLDLSAAVDAWGNVVATYGATRPKDYRNDPNFGRDIKDIGSRLSEGLDYAASGRAKDARTTIKPIRTLLHDLRRRNGVDVYADCVTDLSDVMDEIYVYRHDPPELSDPVQRNKAAGLSEKFGATLERCLEMRPPEYAQSAEFSRLTTQAATAASGMAESALDQDAIAYVNILRELRSLDRIVYFKFGG